MYPELFTLGPLHVRSFGVMMSLAFLVSGLVAAWGFKKRGVDTNLTYNLLIAAMVGGVVGSKIHYLLVHPDQWQSAALSGRGLIWYGGLLGGTLAVSAVAYFSSPPTAVIADAIGPALAAGYAVGRLGCLLNGDDYGVASGLPWAMSFPEGSPPTSELVHPTQAYEILGSLVILGVLIWVLQPRFRRAGSLFWAYIGLAGIERFLVEFVRTNTSVVIGLTQAQLISLGMMVAGAVGVWVAETRGKTVNAAAQGAQKTVGKKGAGVPAGTARRRG